MFWNFTQKFFYFSGSLKMEKRIECCRLLEDISFIFWDPFSMFLHVVNNSEFSHGIFYNYLLIIVWLLKKKMLGFLLYGMFLCVLVHFWICFSMYKKTTEYFHANFCALYLFFEAFNISNRFHGWSWTCCDDENVTICLFKRVYMFTCIYLHQIYLFFFKLLELPIKMPIIGVK